MGGTVRLRKHIIDYLNGNICNNWVEKGVRPRAAGPANTRELLYAYNRATRHGTNTNQLGNILSKDPNIVKVGTIRVGRNDYSSNYEICIWATQEYVEMQIPDFERGDIVFFDEETKTLDRLVREC